MQKNKKRKRCYFELEDKGYSLLELVVSIVILILIMIPLMSNFFRAAKLNKEADKIGDYSNLAANIVEELKAEGIDETAPIDRIYSLDGTLYNAMNPLGHIPAYDVRITADAQEYKYSGKEGHGETLLNDYKLPNITELSSNLNGLLFSYVFQNINNDEILTHQQLVEKLKGHGANEEAIMTYSQSKIADELKFDNIKSLDQLAFDRFQAFAKDYAEDQFKLNSVEYKNYLKEMEKIRNGEALTPPPEPSLSHYPDYCNASNISAYTDKTIDIQITSETTETGIKRTAISYNITYRYNDSISGLNNTFTKLVENNYYSSPVNNIYIFYQKSDFNTIGKPDIIHISNNSDNDVNLYIVKQTGDTSNPEIKLEKASTSTKEINIYTNIENVISDEETINKEIIVTNPPKNHIYSVHIDIFRYEEIVEEKYKTENKLYTLNSVLEVN